MQEAIDDGMFRPPSLPAPLRQIVAVLRDVASGMAHAHAHNFMHGDLDGHSVLLQVRACLPVLVFLWQRTVHCVMPACGDDAW